MEYKWIMFFLIISFSLAFTDFGNGTCECYNCSDCNSALQSASCNYVIVGNDIEENGPCIDLSSIKDKIIDCNGHWMTTYYDAIRIGYFSNITVKNCNLNVTAEAYGPRTLYFYHGSDVKVENTTLLRHGPMFYNVSSIIIDCNNGWLIGDLYEASSFESCKNIIIKDCKINATNGISPSHHFEDIYNLTLNNVTIYSSLYASSPSIECTNCSSTTFVKIKALGDKESYIIYNFYNSTNLSLSEIERGLIITYNVSNVLLVNSSTRINVWESAENVTLENNVLKKLYFATDTYNVSMVVRNNTIEYARFDKNNQQNVDIILENNIINGTINIYLPFGNLTLTNNTIYNKITFSKWGDEPLGGNVTMKYNSFRYCPIISAFDNFFSSCYGKYFFFEENDYFGREIIVITSPTEILNSNVAILMIFNTSNVLIQNSDITIVSNIFAEDSSNITILGSNISFCSSDLLIYNSRNVYFSKDVIYSTLYFKNSSNISFYRNTFINAGIYYTNVSNLNISSNNFELKTTHGIHDKSSSGSGQGIIIENNKIDINYSLDSGVLIGIAVLNATIKNNTVRNIRGTIDFTGGIFCEKLCLIEGNTINGMLYGMGIGNNSIVKNNRINSQYSFYVAGENNLIYNNYINGSVYFYSSSLSNSWNISKTSGTNIVGGPYLGGNFWVGYSETCNDTDNDGICDDPYVIDANNTDYLPLTYFEAPTGTKELPSSINLSDYAFLVSKRFYNVRGIIIFGSFENMLGFVLGYGNPTYYAVIFLKNGVGIYSCASAKCSLQYQKEASIRNGIFMITYDNNNLKAYNNGRLIISTSVSIPQGKVGVMCYRCSLGTMGIISS